MRVNTSERMIKLYQEMIDGDKHEFYDRMCLLWKDHYGEGFYTDYEYRIKKDKIEEAAEAHVESYASYWSDEKRLAKKAFKAGWEACLKDNNNYKRINYGIKKNEIEKATQAYVGSITAWSDEKLLMKKAFKAGARWYRDNNND